MGMVAPQQRIASAYFCHFWQLRRREPICPEERGVCRQWVYREAEAGSESFWRTGNSRSKLCRKRPGIGAATGTRPWEERLAVSVVVDEGHAGSAVRRGWPPPASAFRYRLDIPLDILLRGKQLSVASLGRRSQAGRQKVRPVVAHFRRSGQQQRRSTRCGRRLNCNT